MFWGRYSNENARERLLSGNAGTLEEVPRYLSAFAANGIRLRGGQRGGVVSHEESRGIREG